MSKRKENKVKSAALQHLQKAFDLIEGQYSNIPDCCIEGYLEGRTYMNVLNSMTEKDQKKLHKWHYVPCKKCFKENKINKLKTNGTSVYGQVIWALMDSLKENS